MAWTAPMTAVANTAFTAAQFNQYVRDNLNETAPAKATASGQVPVSTGANAIAMRQPSRNQVATTETTASTSYTDLATVGPTVTVTTGATALVFSSCKLSNSIALGNCFMGYSVNGSGGSDTSALGVASGAAGAWVLSTRLYHEISMTPGSNQFQSKYRVNTGTGTFDTRQLIVFPL